MQADAARDRDAGSAPRIPVARAAWGIVALVFVGSAAVARLAYGRFPTLYDVDSYYHLAVARAYAERGFFDTLDWARFSVMHEAFGDKELLFHVFLWPFASAADPTAGGFTALALLDGLVAAVLAHAGMTAIGPWGLAAPLLAFGGSMDFTSRMVRLRPEIVSLVLVLLAITLAARRRPILLGAVACLYTLTYTPFHAFLGLCGIFFAHVWWTERRLEWPLVVYPAAGIVLGLVVLWRGRTRRSAPSRDTRARDFTLLATLVFGVFYLVSARFVTYFVPLATLAVLQAMEAAGEAPGRTIRIAGRGVPFAAVFPACLLWGVYSFPAVFGMVQAAVPRAFGPDARADWEAFGRAVPVEAKVFAGWQAAEQFVFWAPHATYVNVLDSVFMFAKSPERYRRYLGILEGREPDIPLAARAEFDSDFFADDGQYPLARERLQNDPRVTRLHTTGSPASTTSGAGGTRASSSTGRCCRRRRRCRRRRS